MSTDDPRSTATRGGPTAVGAGPAGSPPPQGGPGADSPRHGSHGTLESALRDVVRGFQVLDRRLVLPGDGTREVELVGVDAAGRLVLVAVAEHADDAALLLVMSALSFAREARSVAARHWRGARTVAAALEPLVVLVAGEVSERTLDALSFLPPASVMVFESRTLEALGGGFGYLVRRELRGARRNTPRSVPELLATWPESARARARTLEARLQRIDPELTLHVEDEALRWSWRDEEIGALACTEGRLLADGAPGQPHVPIDDPDACDAWLEHVLVAHCARVKGVDRPPRPLDVLQRSAGPLLTAEEIAAFRD